MGAGLASTPAQLCHQFHKGSRSPPLSQRRSGCIQRAVRQEVPRLNTALDDKLSARHIDLDPRGYFIIKVDRDATELVADYYTNTIDKDGLACNPDTGEPIPCTAGYTRPPTGVFRGRTAKELSVQIVEKAHPPIVSHLEHANYLGRELQRAEFALITGDEYTQD